jgi:type IV pilus assembly protein PilN
MIQINLLPVREAKRKADVKQNVLELVLVLILVVSGIGFAHSDITGRIETTQNRITQMQNDIEKFKPQLDAVAGFRAKKAELQKKIDVIAGLDRARKGPVRVMEELATHTPERLWLDTVSTKGTKIELTGQSLDNELVAVFLGSLGDSPYFSDVDLNSTELANGPDGLKVVKFKIQATMIAPQTAQAAPAPKAAPGAPAAAAPAAPAVPAAQSHEG